MRTAHTICNSFSRNLLLNLKSSMPLNADTSQVIEQYWYSWFVPFASFMVHVLSDGFTNSFGVYMPVIIKKFKSSRARCSVIGSLLPAFTYLAGPLGALLVNRIGCRSTALVGAALCFSGIAASVLAPSISFLYVSIGIVTAVGFGLAYVPSITAINISFDKRCATAMGLATSGSGVGTFVFSILTGALLRAYDLQGAFLISSAILANLIPAALILGIVRSAPNRTNSRSDTRGKPSMFKRTKKLMTDYRFVMFMASNFLTSLGFNAPYIFMVDYALLKNIGFQRSELLVSIMGVANIVGRILMGQIGDWQKRYRLYLYNSCLVISGLASICEAFSGSFFWAHALFAVMFGFFSGGYVCLTSPTAEDLIGTELITDAFGLVLFVQGTATLIGPPLCGYLFDATLSYTIPFLSFGTAILVSGLMLFFIRPNRHTSVPISSEISLK